MTSGRSRSNAHLLKWDSNHGRFPGEIKVGEDTIDLGRGPIKVTAERDPAKLPHGALGVDIVLECTGIFTTRENAAMHLEAGAKRVIISAPATGADLTVVYGVNHRADHRRTHGDLQRLLHHQLPGAGRVRAEQRRRHRIRLHDDDPRLYQ